MPPCRRRSQSPAHKCNFWSFRDLLSREKERSERHNRFFCLFGLRLRGRSAEEMEAEIRAELRASDYVYSLPQAGDALARIAVLLPETDLPGARIVRKRLMFLCSIKGADFDLGLSVYPDDATTPEELLALAFGGPIVPNAAWLPGGQVA